MQCIDLTCHQFLTPKLARMPRERYLTYYRDLASHHRLEFEENSVSRGGQYSAVELIHPVMEELSVRNNFGNIGYCIFADWAPDFDPDYSAFGPYVLNRWQLNAKLYSVLDQGILSPITCLKLARILSQKALVLMLSFEQTTVPKFKGIKHFKPSLNGTAGMIFSQSGLKINSDNFHVIDCDITETSVDVLVELLLNKFFLILGDIEKIMVSGSGLLFMYKAFMEIQYKKPSGYYLLFIQDVETHCLGYIFLHKE